MNATTAFTTYSITVLLTAFTEMDPRSARVLGRTGQEIPTAYTFTLEAVKGQPVEHICEAVFEATNLQAGNLWTRLAPLQPATRTHTSLSVNDIVVVDGVAVRCGAYGWDRL